MKLLTVLFNRPSEPVKEKNVNAANHPRGEGSSKVVSSTAARMIRSFQSAGNTALKPFSAIKKIALVVTKRVIMAFTEKLKLYAKAASPSSGDVYIKIINDPSSRKVTPKSVMEYLTNGGRSEDFNGQADRSYSNARAVYEYFITHPDSTIFSSENIVKNDPKSTDNENGAEDKINKFKIEFKNPLITPSGQRVSVFIFDHRPGSLGEFRGEVAINIIHNLSFTCLTDLSNQLNLNPNYNFKAKQTAMKLVDKLNSLDKNQAKFYIEQFSSAITGLIENGDSEGDGKYRLKPIGRQSPKPSPRRTGNINAPLSEPSVPYGPDSTQGAIGDNTVNTTHGAGIKTLLGDLQDGKPPVAPRTIFGQDRDSRAAVAGTAPKGNNATSVRDGIPKRGKVRDLINRFENNG